MIDIKIFIDGKESQDIEKDFNDMIYGAIIEVFYDRIGNELKSRLDKENATVVFNADTSQISVSNISNDLYEKINLSLDQS